MRTVRLLAGLAFALAMLAGCSGNSRVGDELTTGALGSKAKGIVLLMLGTADTRCHHLSATFGVREGDGYRAVGGVMIERQSKRVPVGETALEPGEYHLVAYGCRRNNKLAMLGEPSGFQTFAKSYGSFTLQGGEVLNLGFLRATHVREKPGFPAIVLTAHLAIMDWPLPELDRFKQERPALYAQMKTRLLVLTRP